MELIVGVNCYTDIDQANELISDNFMSTNKIRQYWEGLEDDDKKSLIYSSTKLCDTDRLLYKGSKLNIEQKMQFPRRNYWGTIIECPESIKLGIIVNGVQSCIVENESSADFESLKSNGVKSFADGSGARIEFASASELKAADNNKNSMGLFNNVFHKYFIGYTKLV